MTISTPWLFLIPLLPLFGTLLGGVFGRLLGRALCAALCCTLVLLSFLLSIIAFREASSGPPLFQHLWTWFAAGSMRVNAAFLVDHLTAVMLLVVTGVAFLVHVYAIGYMEHDESVTRFFSYLNLFTAAMLILVLGASLPVTFVGWEGVGLASYLLIGFWYQDEVNVVAGRKAFVVNRIGDFGFLLAMFLLFTSVGRLDYQSLQAAHLAPSVITAAGLLLLLGATGKSAQLPLYIWLPDAMQGPTPVSALMHAATMVTAGVYLIARMHFLFVQVPQVMAWVAIVGTGTALLAAVIAAAQNDLKRVLAYSTISQIGYMFVGVGLGAVAAGLFHLVTHAFFKACLFLAAGSVMHGLSGELDIQKMGGLRRHGMWQTATCFAIASIAITGILPISGFFSKDQILSEALHSHAFDGIGLPWLGKLLWAVGTFTAALTSYYIWRAYLTAFEGEPRFGEVGQHQASEEPRQREQEAAASASRMPPPPRAHEAPPVMTIPVWILAGLSVVGLAIGLPGQTSTGEPLSWIASFLGAEPEKLVLWPYGVAIAVAWLGFGTAWWFHGPGHRARASAFADGWPRLTRTVREKLYVDEIYQALVIRPVAMLSRALHRDVDQLLIDRGAVEGTGWLARQSALALRWLQNGDAQAYAAFVAVGALVLLWSLMHGWSF